MTVSCLNQLLYHGPSTTSMQPYKHLDSARKFFLSRCETKKKTNKVATEGTE